MHWAKLRRAAGFEGFTVIVADTVEVGADRRARTPHMILAAEGGLWPRAAPRSAEKIDPPSRNCLIPSSLSTTGRLGGFAAVFRIPQRDWRARVAKLVSVPARNGPGRLSGEIREICPVSLIDLLQVCRGRRPGVLMYHGRLRRCFGGGSAIDRRGLPPAPDGEKAGSLVWASAKEACIFSGDRPRSGG